MHMTQAPPSFAIVGFLLLAGLAAGDRSAPHPSAQPLVPAGKRRLHQITHFAHRRDEPRVFILFQRPLQYVAVEEIPLAARRTKAPRYDFVSARISGRASEGLRG
jgi:hypothetical protein